MRSGIWYPVLRAAALGSLVVRRLDLALFRDFGGVPRAVENRCPHRGSGFQGSRVSNGTLSCPYHGFEFDTESGILMRGAGTSTGSCRVPVLSALDWDGMIWVAREPAHPVPPIPPLPRSAGFRTIRGVEEVDCDPETLVENLLDAMHVAFVHPSFGNRARPEPLGYLASATSDLTGEARFKSALPEDSFPRMTFDSETVRVTNSYALPSSAQTSVSSGGVIKTVRVHVVPREGGGAEAHWSLTRNFMLHPLWDPAVRAVVIRTFREDREALARVKRGSEIHTQFDALQLLRRRARAKAELE